MATAEVLAEDEVTISNLAQIFKRAFFKTSIDKDGGQKKGSHILAPSCSPLAASWAAVD